MVKIKEGPYSAATNFTPDRTEPIEYVVVHYTANDGDTDEGNAIYFRDGVRGASAHYFVDEDSITRTVKDKHVAWHCGTRGTYYHPRCRNRNSLGVEMCSDKDETGRYIITEETVKLTLDLVRHLMWKYNIPGKNVLRHYDVTHKTCPEPWVSEVQLWYDFKKLLMEDDMTQDQFNEMYNSMIAEKHGDKPSSWAEKSCKKAQEKGVFNGDGDSNYDWQEPLTREATAIILDNMNLLD